MSSNSPSTSTAHEIKILIRSHQPLLVFETVEEERVGRILEDVSRDLEMPLFEWTLSKGLYRRDNPVPFHGTRDVAVALKHVAGLTVVGIFHFKDLGDLLSDSAVRRLVKELLARFAQSRSTLVLSAPGIELPPDIADWAVIHRLLLPGVEELKGVVRDVLQAVRLERPVTIELSPDGLERLVRSLRGLTLKQARQVLAYAVLLDGKLSEEDVGLVAERKAEMIADEGLLEFYPVQGNRYELGGFRRLKDWLQRARLGFTTEAKRYNLSPPRGILLVGVQGCGKSLAAKSVAREWQMPLLKLDATRLYAKYVGESERNFRRATQQAEALAPIVLWIDEIEKALAAGGGDADGGLSRRILGFFLTWLQEKPEGVFVVATANDIAALPPELLRKGRFDEIFFVDLPDEEERRQIFEIHLRLRNFDPTIFDLAGLSRATEGFSGAEIEQLVTTALYRSLQERKPLSTSLLLQEATATRPLSVTRKEDIESLRRWAAGRFVPAN
ncbi:MAG: AAA family ATPase [Acidobacteriota bacterium]